LDVGLLVRALIDDSEPIAIRYLGQASQIALSSQKNAMIWKKLMYLAPALIVTVAVYMGWKLTSRSAYESADYTVIESEAPFEVREYPDLLMATTETQFSSQGDDGSFMRLFGYISGANEGKQKVAMTTPVFMDREADGEPGQMGFVIPTAVLETGAPKPSRDDVDLKSRRGGRFAVIRFSGRLNSTTFASAEERLREWMAREGLTAGDKTESAGYDPPWTPGPFRRNELLIRLK
jgi:hypothetical protein